jgi:hypothetical protein
VVTHKECAFFGEGCEDTVYCDGKRNETACLSFQGRSMKWCPDAGACMAEAIDGCDNCKSWNGIKHRDIKASDMNKINYRIYQIRI